MGRSPCCDKAAVKRGPWSEEEDARLRSYIEQHGGASAAAATVAGGWMALPRKAGLRRCGKSCRLRWLNYLRPGVRHGGFSPEEDRVICALYAAVGSRWSLIAAHLPGRTDNGVKNYWNTRLKKSFFLFGGNIPLPLPPPQPSRRRPRIAGWNNADVISTAVPVPPCSTARPYGTAGGCVEVGHVRIGASGMFTGSGGTDDMIARGTNAGVVSRQPADTITCSSNSRGPAATSELDEIFRSTTGTSTTADGENNSDMCQSSTEVETNWYHHCQYLGVPYLYW